MEENVMLSTDPEFLTVEEVCKRYRVSNCTIRNAIKKGEMNAIKIGHIYRLPSKNLFRKNGEDCRSTTVSAAVPQA